MTLWLLAAAAAAALDSMEPDLGPPPAPEDGPEVEENVELQVGGIAFTGADFRGTGVFAGVGWKVGRRLWIDADAITADLDWSGSGQNLSSVGARVRWENTGGSFAAGVRTVRVRDHGCEQPLEGAEECETAVTQFPLPTLEWRAGRLDRLHVTGGLFGGVRTNPTLGFVRGGIGHPFGDARLEAGIDTSTGGYLLGDFPLDGERGTLRVTVGGRPGSFAMGAQLLFRFR